jgi:hypothetical protein
LAIAFSRIFATCSSINCGSKVNTYGHLRDEVGLAPFNFSAPLAVWWGAVHLSPYLAFHSDNGR